METEESFDKDYEIQSRKGSEVGEISARILAASLENEKNKRGPIFWRRRGGQKWQRFWERSHDKWKEG